MYDDKTEQFSNKEGIGMHVDIKDPDSKVILSKYYTNEGKFVFTTHTPGEHSICISPNSTRWFSGGSRLVSGKSSDMIIGRSVAYNCYFVHFVLSRI